MTLDRITARALVEAGYMSLPDYIEMFGEEVSAEAFHHSPDIAPDVHHKYDLPASRKSKNPSIV